MGNEGERVVATGAFPARVVGPECPTPVERAAMVHWWEELTFLHWQFDPDDVQRLLPPGLTVETFDGAAWVGLVPFWLRVGLPGVPSVPWMSEFCETNVRTYAIGPDGEAGVWFFSLDAARLGAVVTARATYRLPYFWSRMRLSHVGDVLTYTCRRRWPGPRGARSQVAMRIGEQYAPGELTDLDHWLTARWALWSAPRSGLRFAQADHCAWPLHRADVLHVDDELLAAAGLPRPEGDPVAHWSRSVEVRIGWPQLVVPAR